MGGGKWTNTTYTNTTARKLATGQTFEHSRKTAAKPREERKVHPDLDPTKFGVEINGIGVRESRDSAEHPNSTAIAVIFDDTASMGVVPKKLQEKLPNLLGLLLRKGYVDDPQILYGAIGDEYSDSVPLQMGQFESDNRMDDALDNIYLEENGGGGDNESYQLALHWIAQHTATDCFEKRNQKGYLFMIGDEKSFVALSPGSVKKFIGDDLPQRMSLEEVIDEVKKKWNLFFIIPENTIYQGSNLEYWRGLLGQNALLLPNEENVAELIATTIGVCEGTIDLDEVESDLKEIGASGDTVKTVTNALATVAAGGSGGIAKVEGDKPDLSGESGSTRL